MAMLVKPDVIPARRRLRGCVTADGLGKHDFPTRRVATQALRHQQTTVGSTGLMVYRCHDCGRYHIGHGRKP